MPINKGGYTAPYGNVMSNPPKPKKVHSTADRHSAAMPYAKEIGVVTPDKPKMK